METTLNIRTDILKRISLAAQHKKISNSEMIAILIKSMMDTISNPENIGKMVPYQQRRNHGDWHTFHLYVRVDEYEYFLDMRKLLKMSVSLILAYAVEQFLDKLIKIKNTDNNRYGNYIIAKEVIDDIICWRLIWGFPHNLRKLFINP